MLSVRLVTDKSGNVVSRRDFKPFGEDLAADQTFRKTTDKYSTATQDKVRQRFTGYLKDIETGLDFAEARMYENRHGRFTAVDPLLASGKSANPQTFNRFAYVGNRPTKLIDPSGLCPPEEEPCITDENGNEIPGRYGPDGVNTYCIGGPCSQAVASSSNQTTGVAQAATTNPTTTTPRTIPNSPFNSPRSGPLARRPPGEFSAPRSSPATRFSQNASRSVRVGAVAFAIGLVVNELVSPSQTVGGDECDRGIPDCTEPEDRRKSLF
ncbi:MAG: RHS repeat-associated core domain-containing protein [Acidobacteria bacterium]|nr:RHS repeat-associated core domain-containing protein [Acidobacteriota bacterium]